MAPGTPLRVLSDTITVRVDPEETGGAFAVLEEVTPPGAGVPPHVHDRTDETFVVLDGEAEFSCGARTIRGGRGTVVFVPRGTPHAFRNAGKTPLRQIVTLTPPDFVRFFQAVHDAAASDPAAVMALAQGHDIRFV